jgi:hypothetical protein
VIQSRSVRAFRFLCNIIVLLSLGFYNIHLISFPLFGGKLNTLHTHLTETLSYVYILFYLTQRMSEEIDVSFAHGSVKQKNSHNQNHFTWNVLC